MGYLREKEAAWIRCYYIARILQIWSTAEQQLLVMKN